MKDLKEPTNGTEVHMKNIKEINSGVFILDLDGYATAVDPKNYYYTSGEAISKAEKLIEDTQRLLDGLKNMHQDLLSIRGENKYLETEMDNGEITIKIKNPRSKKEKIKNENLKLKDLKGFMNYGDILYVKDSKSVGSKEVKTYCAIDPDKEEYIYFNTYDGTVSDKKAEKSAIDVEKFTKKLEKNGYKRILL